MTQHTPALADPVGDRGSGPHPLPPLENQKWLYVSLKILVRTSPRELRSVRPSVKYVDDFKRGKLPPPPPPPPHTHLQVSNGAKIRNRYNQVPHLTQDTNGKVTNSQKTPQTRAKRSALSQQVTTKHIYTDAHKTQQTQDRTKT